MEIREKTEQMLKPQFVAEYCGIKIYTDNYMPEDEARFQDREGNVLGVIQSIQQGSDGLPKK